MPFLEKNHDSKIKSKIRDILALVAAWRLWGSYKQFPAYLVALRVWGAPSAWYPRPHGIEKLLPICQDTSMKVGAFELHEPVPELKDPHVLAAVCPWVDVGNSVSIALSLLEHHYGAKELGRLTRPGKYFDFTRYRPTIRLVDGIRNVTVPNSIMNYAHTPEGYDLLLLHLMEPHAFGEDYADSVLELLNHLGIKRYCRLGAMYDVVPHTRPLRVTGDTGKVATRSNAGDLKTTPSTYQGPTSIVNLVSEGVPKIDPDIDVMNFMVHLPQYLQLEEDYLGAARLLEVLSSIYDLPPDLPPTEKGSQQYRELDKAVERNPELKTLIQRMESQYDAEEASTDEESPPSGPLAPEVERFLEEMDRRFSDTQ